MLRILGAVFLVFAGAVLGASKSDSLKARYAACREIRELLVQISVLVRYRGLNVYEISHELMISDRYKQLDFIKKLPSEYEPDTDFRLKWAEAVNSDSCIGDDEKKLLCSFGAGLGTSDIQGQLMAVETVLEALRRIEDKRCEEYNRKGKLYRSLGMLFGVMTGILLI